MECSKTQFGHPVGSYRLEIQCQDMLLEVVIVEVVGIPHGWHKSSLDLCRTESGTANKEREGQTHPFSPEFRNKTNLRGLLECA
jgi:hypothetical protein